MSLSLQSANAEPGAKTPPPAYPHARDDEAIVAQEVGDEFVVYDLTTNKVHDLNPTATAVWRMCDGATPPEEMSQRLAAQLGLPLDKADPLLWLSLEKLDKAKLLTSGSFHRQSEGLTRRRVLRVLGTASLLPVVYTMVAPTAAHAQSADCCADIGAPTVIEPNCTGNCSCYDINSNPGQCVRIQCFGGANISCETYCNNQGGNFIADCF